MRSKCILHYLSSTTVVIDETTISVKRYYCNANKGEVENIFASGFVHNFKPVLVKQKMSTLFIENNMSGTSVLFSCEGP
jgi:hypothetical protein